MYRDPYLTLCMMSVNGGGWTLFYKNSDSAEQGNSYISLLENAAGFVNEEVDIYEDSVVGVSPVQGLRPISLMVVPVDSPSSSISVIHLNDVDVAESIVDPSNLIDGCNSYDKSFIYVNNGISSIINGIQFENGTLSFSNCTQESSIEFTWMGDVFSSNSTRVSWCGQEEGGQCMYFLREEVTYNPEECMCRASGVDNMIWPATACGEVRQIACYEGIESGILQRQCGNDGQWEEFIQGTCSCSAETAFETSWPTTEGGVVAHVACVNDISKSRDRLCQPNGEWSTEMTGGCSCNAEVYQGIQWGITEGGKQGNHACDTGAIGNGYQRECNMDGTWSLGVEGICQCPSQYSNGVTWEVANPNHKQDYTCHENAVGDSMSRTCSVYGSWYPIQGNCDCPEEEIGYHLWPQTVSGLAAQISCSEGSIGTASTRVCNAGGNWGEVVYGSCSCPMNTWTNYAGTSYTFPESNGNSTVTVACQNGIEGEMTRYCNYYGEWSTPIGCYEPVYCPAETVGEIHFEETEGGHTVMIMCKNDSAMSYGRLCGENGEWEDVIGYCECSSITDSIGNVYPTKVSGESFSMNCIAGYEGTVSGTCSVYGEWINIESTCVRKQCTAEEDEDHLQWPVTDSESTSTLPCNGIGEGWSRECTIDGIWSTREGSCSCPAITIDGNNYPQSVVGTIIHSTCPSGYRGSYDRVCNGSGEWSELVNNCERIHCPAEDYQDIHWPMTEGGTTAIVGCPLNDGNNQRYCRADGEWSSVVTGNGCRCGSTVVNENGMYVFSETAPDVTVTKSCTSEYSGIIRYTCSRAGIWKDLDNQCERIMCPSESSNGIFFPTIGSGLTQHVNCSANAIGNGYDRLCDENGVWSSTIEGSCSCGNETVRHNDGHLYTFEETMGGDVVTQVCGGDLAGSIYRTCSVYGNWQSIHGECRQLMCPEEILDNYIWPVTNSSTTVELSCNSYQIGSVSRYCHPAGVWGDPVNNCHEVQCEDITVKKLANGCMNVRFNPYETMPFVRANVVPASSPEFSVEFRGKTVRICGLSANIAYSMFVQYCNDENYSECSDACIVSDIYYQQTCNVMETVDISDVSVDDDDKTTISFSVKFPTCPYPANSVEIVYECIEDCPEDAETIVESTPCTSLDGCQAGHRSTIHIEGSFSQSAKYRVKQRMQLEGQFSELQPYSEAIEFRLSDFQTASELQPSVELLNSRNVRLHLGEVNGLVLYKKHVIYIYKKRAGTRRRLVDSLFSTVTLCPLGNGVCEESFTDVTVEPGYDYSFSIYSYPIVSGSKVQVSITATTIDTEPTYDMSVEAGDHFMKVTLSNCKYDVIGTCSFIPQTESTGNQAMLSVSLEAGKEASFITRDLIVNTVYTVSCVLEEEFGIQSRVTKEVSTTPLMEPTLEISLLSDTVYDVKVGLTVNKPVNVYCSVSSVDVIPSATELRLYGNEDTITNYSEIKEVSLLINDYYNDHYRVSCLAVDIFGTEVVNSLVVVPSGIPFTPELVSTTPADGSVNVNPFVQLELTFRHPIVVSGCQFCFFILYNGATRTSTNLYSNAFTVKDNKITFMTNQLDSGATYQLKTSTRGLILDATTNIAYSPSSDVLMTFTVKIYGNVDGDIDIDDLFPVNGVITIEYSSYMILNEGTITLNSLSIDASNLCLEIQHKTSDSTTLLIPVYDCVGMLRSSTSYVLVLPKNLLVTRDMIPSPRLTHVFETKAESYPPKKIGSFPLNDDVVPTDVSIELVFDQQIQTGNGYLFITEYDGNKIITTYNIPGSQAVLSTSYPYKATWDLFSYGLQPHHKYIISWSEGLVKNLNNENISASTIEDNVMFKTDSGACSASYLADSIETVFDCIYDKNQCICSSWNMLAMVNMNM